MWPKYNLGLQSPKKAVRCFRSDNNLMHLHIHLLCVLSQRLNLSVPVPALNEPVWDAFPALPVHTNTHSFASHSLRSPLLVLLNCNPIFLDLWCNYATAIALTWKRDGGARSTHTRAKSTHKASLLCIKKIKAWNCLRPALCLSYSLLS